MGMTGLLETNVALYLLGGRSIISNSPNKSAH
jgi:hypothetical protein